ncbi:hypothetical protein MMC34_002467 [Xylographa carneopallida]|nr:hypothetical protein [Xylographa carneopallida]
MASSYKYSKVADALADEEAAPPRWSLAAHHPSFKQYGFFALILVLSLLSNILFAFSSLISRHDDSSLLIVDRPTPYAGLVFDTPRRFTHGGPLSNPNDTTAWEALNFDLGNLALPDTYADAKGLPRAQRFIWDDSLGLYFLNAFHSVHCLKILHTVLYELAPPSSVPLANLSWPFPHAVHCLDALLQDTYCFADDTPRYESLAHPAQPGDNQARVCRDWSKLEKYAKEHSACWRDVNATVHIDGRLRYRYCPPGSPYFERVREMFPDFVWEG